MHASVREPARSLRGIVAARVGFYQSAAPVWMHRLACCRPASMHVKQMLLDN